jgi:serine/threonine-protein kinase
LSDVVGTLHERGIVHRDIKPANVGFGERGEPKLMDFGLARMMDAAGRRGARRGAALPVTRIGSQWGTADPNETLTVQGSIVGTLLYMSPEALRGVPADASRDLWSLAITLFEAVTGVNPASADNVEDAHQRIVGGSLSQIVDFLPDAQVGLNEFFLHALSTDPTRRPRSAREFCERFLSAATSASPVS